MALHSVRSNTTGPIRGLNIYRCRGSRDAIGDDRVITDGADHDSAALTSHQQPPWFGRRHPLPIPETFVYRVCEARVRGDRSGCEVGRTREADFRRYRLGQWTQHADAWLPREAWQASSYEVARVVAASAGL